MSVELLQTLSTVAYIVAGVLLLVAIALFFLLNISKIFGDLSGKNAKKAIENIRKKNEGIYREAERNEDGTLNTDNLMDTEKISTTRLAMDTTVLSNVTLGQTAILDEPTGRTATRATFDISIPFSVEMEIGYCYSKEIIQ